MALLIPPVSVLKVGSAVHQHTELEAPAAMISASGESQSLPGLPQLCHTGLLRISSEQSTLVLFLGSCSWSLSTQPPLAAVGMSASHSSAGKCCLVTNSGEFLSALPSEHLWLLYSPLRFQNSPCPHPWGGFWMCWNFFLLHSSLPQMLVPVPKSLFFFFKLIFCPASFWEDWLCLLKSGISCQHSECILCEFICMQMYFDVFGGGSWSSCLILHHLWKVPSHLLVIKFEPLRISLDLFSLSSIFSLKSLWHSRFSPPEASHYHSGRSTASSSGSVTLPRLSMFPREDRLFPFSAPSYPPSTLVRTLGDPWKATVEVLLRGRRPRPRCLMRSACPQLFHFPTDCWFLIYTTCSHYGFRHQQKAHVPSGCRRSPTSSKISLLLWS